MDKETRKAISTMIIELRNIMRPLIWHDKDMQAAHDYLSEAIDIMQGGGENFNSIKEPLTCASRAITHVLNRCRDDNQQLEDISRTISEALKLFD